MGVTRKIFYSFHYNNDVLRVGQIRGIGALEDNQPVTPNDWEEVKKGGRDSIARWIDENMKNRTCLIVLIGEETANRHWVRYEITKAWKEGKGIVGIYIHNFKCMQKMKESPYTGKCTKGRNPFETLTVGGQELSTIIRCYDPNPDSPYTEVKDNLEKWVEEAIQFRTNYAKQHDQTIQ